MIFPLSYYLHNFNYSTNEKDMKNPLYYFNMEVLVLLFRAFSIGRIAELLITLSLGGRARERGEIKHSRIEILRFAQYDVSHCSLPKGEG